LALSDAVSGLLLRRLLLLVFDGELPILNEWVRGESPQHKRATCGESSRGFEQIDYLNLYAMLNPCHNACDSSAVLFKCAKLYFDFFDSHACSTSWASADEGSTREQTSNLRLNGALTVASCSHEPSVQRRHTLGHCWVSKCFLLPGSNDEKDYSDDQNKCCVLIFGKSRVSLREFGVHGWTTHKTAEKSSICFAWFITRRFGQVRGKTTLALHSNLIAILGIYMIE